MPITHDPNTTTGEEQVNDIVLIKKKDKKRNRDHVLQETTQVIVPAQTEETTVEKKKKKKNKNKSNGEPKDAIVESNQTTEVANNDVTDSNDQSEKRKKKKQKKQRHEEADVTPMESESVAEHTNGNGVEKKKKKKKKDQQETEQPQVAAPVEDKKSKSKENGNTKANGTVRFNFYEEHSKATADEVNAYRTENRMTLSFLDTASGELTEQSVSEYPESEKDLKPIRAFSELVLPEPKILSVTKGFTKPTPIQSQCWPFILSGNDIIGIAETGSGKTLAFGIPALVHILDQQPVKNNQGPIALILSPTRELAIQTFEVCQQAGEPVGVRSACFYGGVSKDSQYAALRAGLHIVVATPGRLLDLMNEGVVNLSRVTYMVLDEADRMLDKGFEMDIRTIFKQIPSVRQTIMFSATWPTSIRNLAATFLRNPVRVTIGSPDLTANHRVKQIVEVVEDPRARDYKLIQLLQEYHRSRKNRVLVFALYKKEAARLETMLNQKGWTACGIHGDMSQKQREDALGAFKTGKTPLMVATDVAARGLDIPDVEYVINYSFPLTVEDYVHRIGRTGRAGKTGTAYTFFQPSDKIRAAELVGVLQESKNEVPEELRKLGSYGTAKKQHALYGNHYADLSSKPLPKKTHYKFDE